LLSPLPTDALSLAYLKAVREGVSLERLSTLPGFVTTIAFRTTMICTPQSQSRGIVERVSALVRTRQPVTRALLYNRQDPRCICIVSGRLDQKLKTHGYSVPARMGGLHVGTLTCVRNRILLILPRRSSWLTRLSCPHPWTSLAACCAQTVQVRAGGQCFLPGSLLVVFVAASPLDRTVGKDMNAVLSMLVWPGHLV
jgi:hypothetical protein